MTRESFHDELEQLAATWLALGRRLEDAKDRRDRGRLDDGRYADMALDFDSQRLNILFQIRRILIQRDDDVATIVQDAINGETESVTMSRLADVARQKKFPQRIVDGLEQHQGTIVSWLVQIGFEIAKRAGAS